MMDSVIAAARIGQLHARYADALWRRDFNAFAACFAADGEWRIAGRVFRGRVEIRDAIETILERYRRVLITFHAPIVGPAAEYGARTYVTEQCMGADGSSNMTIGTYFDRFVDDGDRWTFSWRLFQLHYRGPADLSGQFFENPDYGAPPAMPAKDACSIDHTSAGYPRTQ